MRIPRGLMEAAETAQIFSQENEHSDQLLVTLGNGKIKIKGQGVSGWYEETKKTDYTGRTLSFLASPRLLMELTKRFTECEIAEDRLKVVGAKLSYMTSLGTLDAAQDTPAVTVKE